MLTVDLSRDAGAPSLYMQLYEGIREMVINGELAVGEKLPSKKKLAVHLQVSVKTVENAYFQLQLEGYIYSKEKVGFFVSEVSGFRGPEQSSRKRYVSKYREERYRLDIKANKTPPEMFPFSVWARLGREVDADRGSRLLETVPFNGVEELRRAIAEHLRGFRGMDVSPDQVIVGSGTEYLYQRLLHLLGPDCVIGMEDPGYAHIRTILRVQGVPLKSIPMDGFGIRSDLLEASGANALHVSPMHHFPLGTTMPVQRRVELLQWANRGGGRTIIEDDYNCEYLYQGAPVKPIFAMDIRQRVVYMNTFSKTIAPGIRVAYMVLPDRLMDRYLETMSFYSCTVSNEVQYRLARFISDGHFERYIHRVRQHNVEQRRMLSDAIASSAVSDCVSLIKSVAGTHVLLRLDTALPDAKVLKRLSDVGIHASFVSEYCMAPSPGLEHLLIVNYSRLTDEDVNFLLSSIGSALC